MSEKFAKWLFFDRHLLDAAICLAHDKAGIRTNLLPNKKVYFGGYWCMSCGESQWAEAYYPKEPKKEWFKFEPRTFDICKFHNRVDCKDCLEYAKIAEDYAEVRVKAALEGKNESQFIDTYSILVPIDDKS